LLLVEGHETVQHVDFASGARVDGRTVPLEPGQHGGIEVYFGDHSSGLLGQSETPHFRWNVTGSSLQSDGTFAFEGIPAGTYTFYARILHGSGPEQAIVAEGVLVAEVAGRGPFGTPDTYGAKVIQARPVHAALRLRLPRLIWNERPGGRASPRAAFPMIPFGGDSGDLEPAQRELRPTGRVL